MDSQVNKIIEVSANWDSNSNLDILYDLGSIYGVSSSSVNHISIFSEGWIDLVFSGSKTIESRFSKTRGIPFGRVSMGDIVFMKESGGPIRGLFFVSGVKFYENLTEHQISEIDVEYNEEIFGRSLYFDHWDRWLECHHATLVWIGSPIIKFDRPLEYKSRGRSAWRILSEPLDIGIKL